MPQWSRDETLGALVIGTFALALGSLAALDFGGHVASFALRDRERWMRRRWKTGMFPSPGTYRFVGGAFASIGWTLVLGAVAQPASGVLRAVLGAVALGGAAAFVVFVIAAVVASMVAQGREDPNEPR